MKQQVVYITGGEDTSNYDGYYGFLRWLEYNPYEESFLNWNKTLGKYLWEEKYEYLKAPLRETKYADYEAWKIMFEKMFPYLREDFILVVTSLGGSFILKYMLETDFPRNLWKNMKKIFFLAPALRETPDETLGSFMVEVEKLSELKNIADEIYIYHSTDDIVVPFEQSEELLTYFPDAVFRKYEDKGHFFLEERIPDLEKDIKK